MKAQDVKIFLTFALVTLLLAAMITVSPAQPRPNSETFRGPDGRVTGHSYRDSQGTTHFYDASGKRSGTATTNSQGTTQFYGQDGRRAGTATPQTLQPYLYNRRY